MSEADFLKHLNQSYVEGGNEELEQSMTFTKWLQAHIRLFWARRSIANESSRFHV